MKYRVETNHPVAIDSRDHTHPAGSAHDNSRNPTFNRKLFALYPEKKIRLMDLGCSGGGFAKDMIDAGHEAIGIEGSDYSLLRKRAEWATIPDNLFTADITKPFVINRYKESHTYFLDNERPLAEFDVVSAWEVMEHISEDGLPQLIQNVLDHLAPEGVWIMSVSTQQGFHHVTVKNKAWWLQLFAQHGLKNEESLVNYFGDDWIRGPHQNAPESFHLILGRES